MLTLAVKPALYIWPGVFPIVVLNVMVKSIPYKPEQEGYLLLHGTGKYRGTGGVAQMVERSLSMREVPGSIPGASKFFILFYFFYLNLYSL